MLRTGSRAALALLGVLSLGACAVARPPMVSVPLRASALPERVRIEAGSDLARTLAAAIGPKLAARGIAVDAASTQILTIAASDQPADLGITLAGGSAASPPRKHRFYHRCATKRLKATIMLRQADAPQPSAMVHGWVDKCEIGQTAISTLSDAMAQAL